MTPEQRASLVVREFYSRRTRGHDPDRHAEFEAIIADAIRDAERAATLAERARCLAAVDAIGRRPETWNWS